MIARLRRRLAAALAPAVLIDIALPLLPFWPGGLLPREMTAYLARIAVGALAGSRR